MKRMHIHLAVDGLEKNIRFYSTIFGAKPSVQKDDYAKWYLEEPGVNFAISVNSNKKGLDHLGIQVEAEDELAAVSSAMEQAGIEHSEERNAACCYASSHKHWALDPQGIAWEAFLSVGTSDANCEGGVEVNDGAISCCVPTTLGRDEEDGKCCIPTPGSACCN